MSHMNTVAPAAASVFEVQSPIPLAAPVMTEVLFVKVRATAIPISSVAPKSAPAHNATERLVASLFMSAPLFSTVTLIDANLAFSYA